MTDCSLWFAGSSQANPFACVASGIAALWGPAHGGANEAVLRMLEEIGERCVLRAFSVPCCYSGDSDQDKPAGRGSCLQPHKAEH